MKNTRITGTLIKNFFHCKRQAYLYYYGLNFHSEFTRIGELMHLEEGKKEIAIDGIKLDDIKDNSIHTFFLKGSNLDMVLLKSTTNIFKNGELIGVDVNKGVVRKV